MLVRDWAIAFVATLLAECPVYALSSRRSFGATTALALALLLNLATHPAAWTVFRFGRISFPVGFLAVEAMVVVVETLLLFFAARSRLVRQRLSGSRCLAISFVANCFSAGLGLLIWP